MPRPEPFVLRCLDCGRADPPCGWAPTTIVVEASWAPLVWEHRCRDCARVRDDLRRPHALVGGD